MQTAQALILVRRLSRVALWVCVAVVAYLAFTPSADPPGTSWDKANHLLAFAVMAGLADIGWPARGQAAWRWGLLLGYGLLIETVQLLLPLRHFSFLDLVADGLGVLLYMGVRAFWRRWVESRARN